jgi:hypothetical protein
MRRIRLDAGKTRLPSNGCGSRDTIYDIMGFELGYHALQPESAGREPLNRRGRSQWGR